MLNGMTRFVSGNSDCCDRIAVVNAVRKADNMGAGVVMVGERAGNALYPYVAQSVLIENSARYLRAGVTGIAAHTLVF